MTFVESLNNFPRNKLTISMVLTKHVISSKAKDKNLVFSPLSIHVVLALIAAGSSGQLLEKVLDYFKSKSIDDLSSSLSRLVGVLLADGSYVNGPLLAFANGVWVDKKYELNQGFKDIAQNLYKAVTEQADFEHQAEKERRKLNKWAEDKTNGLIKDIIPPGWIKASTALVFGNALYFKEDWCAKFDKSYTKDRDFFLLDGSSIKAPFMTSYKYQFISAFKGFKVLRLSYKRRKDELRMFSMHIFLPDLKDGLPSLFDALAAEPGFLERHLAREGVVEVVDFRIPKFKICFDFDALDVCKEFGLSFSSGLTKVVDGDLLTIDSILHKSFIEVNEGGTEAAAVTFASGLCCSAGRPPPKKKMNFVADHPFLFVVREDKSGTLLFVGQVVNPLVE